MNWHRSTSNKLRKVVIIICSNLFFVFSFQIAKITEMNRFGLVFGCNMFAALVLQTILTAIVAEKHGLALPAKKQVSNVVEVC